MNYKTLYNMLYKMLENVTPLTVDCGGLCNGACCLGDDETGMYLFPYEEKMFNSGKQSFIKVDKTDFFVNGKNVPIAICSGKCNRKYRPLSCRIFPLIMKNNEIVLDKRGFGICPLVKYNDISVLNPEFVKAVKKAYNIMNKFREFKEFNNEISKLIDEDYFFEVK